MTDEQPPKPKHVAGQIVYVGLRVYDPETQKMRHYRSLRLPKWTPAEVYQILVDAFTAHQVKPQ